MDNSPNILSKIYPNSSKTSYATKYGLEIFISIIIFTIFFIATSYFHTLNNIKPIKDDWANKRCSPAVMSFSGLISKSENETVFEATTSNFTYCIQNILSNVTSYALQPFNYLVSTITSEFQSLLDSVNAIRAEFDKIRNSVTDVGTDVFSRILNILMPVLEMVISTKDICGKVIATMTAGLYTFFGAFLTMQSTFLLIYNFINITLYTLAAMIIAEFIMMAFPLALGTSAIMGSILIPMIVIQLFMQDILSIQGDKSLPKMPHCFAGDTLIMLNNNKQKKFKDLNIGDVLVDGSTVTAFMKLSSQGQEFYNFNGITVTGNHSIYYKEDWIPISKHPESYLIEEFREPFIYCINTDSKTIKIEDHIFADWDDLDDKDLEDIKKNCCYNTNLPYNFTKKDIHKYLDAGFDENTTIELDDGRSIKIKDIEVNDTLRNGENVVGIVKIDCSDVAGLYEYNINNNTFFYCTGNILIKDLGNINTFDLIPKNIKIAKFAYHLLTNTGSYVINGIRIGDYNTSIEKYLSSCSTNNLCLLE
tara:strand:- start:967 stop:2568 length:1602 start_codon:yes stop_codon:yes gene_type:complete